MNSNIEQDASSTPLSEWIATPAREETSSISDLWDLKKPNWIESVVDQLRTVTRLGQGWDGFGAGSIRHDVIAFAGHVISEIMRLDTPPPVITPLSHEGLMLEWHEQGIDLEIEIERPGSMWVSFEDAVTGTEEEEALTNNLSMIAKHIAELTKRVLRNK